MAIGTFIRKALGRELPNEEGELIPVQNELGQEIPDPTPIAPPIGYKRQPSIFEQMRSMIQSDRLRAEALATGHETFEEADDFEVGDDVDPRSGWENDYDPPISQVIDDGAKALEERLKNPPAASSTPTPPPVSPAPAAAVPPASAPAPTPPVAKSDA